eukprot:CAMPEP_0115721096 /NCGR_PEP_ID=MMETSP0272-20121206/78901_1 /TAXON_ID=71861 /ORGANISM="Scrippsiella trochoidea, Strain CCMP3099" /LENGTH=61 /DNA_ID=CAMNT_0003163907 /DNA_START=308 /DNA_END=490 /DNA_ORIENTATION=-
MKQASGSKNHNQESKATLAAAGSGHQPAAFVLPSTAAPWPPTARLYLQSCRTLPGQRPHVA